MIKIKRLLLLLSLITICVPSTLVYASSDIGWPVDIEATEIEEEQIPEPMEAIDEIVIEETESLSPIDNSTTGINDKAVFGEEYDLINRLGEGSRGDSGLTEAEKIYSNYSDVVPVVTTDQMVEWILRKGNELISILQVFAQPFAIIIFIISAAICLIGSLAKGNMASKGLMGMIASALLYTAVLYAPLLVNTITGFMSS